MGSDPRSIVFREAFNRFSGMYEPRADKSRGNRTRKGEVVLGVDAAVYGYDPGMSFLRWCSWGEWRGYITFFFLSI